MELGRVLTDGATAHDRHFALLLLWWHRDDDVDVDVDGIDEERIVRDYHCRRW